MMAKALFAAYLIALSIGSAVAYATECSVGPEYWCQSFEHAQDCGALRHCSDTVWNNDAQYASAGSSATCQWCERILGKIHDGLGDNPDMLVSAFTNGCQLLPLKDLSAKCTNAIENYASAVILLMKNKHFAALCRLMNICTSEKPEIILGSNRCTWGPSYWCSSLSNTHECGSVDHCSNKIWSQQAIQKKENDNVCQYCGYIMDKLRLMVTENQTPIDVKEWLTGACKMLEAKEAIDECVKTMSQYGPEILVLVQNQIDSGIICHLGQMCKEATIIPRVKSDEDQSQMLCNVIVRATHDLHVNQQKTENEIEIFLKNDCQKLPTADLQQKCGDVLKQYGSDIYSHVANKMELSKICDITALQPLAHVRCDLCTFVTTNTKVMIDAKNSEAEVLSYLDDQLCARLEGDIKENCKSTIKTNGKELFDQIGQGTQPLLICTYFQLCFNELVDKSSPIQKEEMRSFLKDNICNNLGVFEDSCHALMENDAARLLKSLSTDLDGDVLCEIFGVCPRKASWMDRLLIGDDTDKCKRCVNDFTRRKHIGEKLVNYSSEFLTHFCGQLSKKDECITAVGEPIDKLRQFIQSLDSKDICLELKACNATSLENMKLTPLDYPISKEAIGYIKDEICPSIGPLSNWCNHLMDTEGADLFQLVSKDVDPHRVCSVIDICPTTNAFDNCNDKCECCVSKVENYQVQLAGFLQTILVSTEALCERIPYSDECRNTASDLKSRIYEIVASFNAKAICQTLTHCPASTTVTCEFTAANQCSCCESNIKLREANFQEAISKTIQTNFAFCNDNGDVCLSNLRSKQEAIIHRLLSFNPLTLCERFGFCSNENSQRSIPLLSDVMVYSYSDLNGNLKELSENICADFEEIKPICEHLIISHENARYKAVYMALLNSDTALIDQDFRAQSTDTCDGCKNAVQTTKNFWINSLTSVRDALLKTCEYCPVKAQCQTYYNQQFDLLKSFIDQIDPQQFCQKIHLCSVASTETCGTCAERLDARKDVVLQAIDRLAGYFNDLCQKHAGKSCQVYVQEIKTSIQKSIEEFDSKDVCTNIGFCGTTAVTKEFNFDQYERSIEEEFEKNICSNFGPFEVLCKDVIHGNTEHIQSLEMNYDIGEIMDMEDEPTEVSAKPDGKCQCRRCIARVQQRKRRTKFIGNLIYLSLIHSCNKCPVKQQCRKYFIIAKAKFNKKIDKICPYLVCKRLGYCNKSKDSNETEIQPIQNSNSTCILCEYVMNALSGYIHQQSTEEEIEANLEKVCDQIPSVLQNQCREYVENYSPTIVSLLLAEFNLSTVCQRLNLCTNQMKVDLTHLIKADRSTCGVCDYMSTYIQFALQRNSKGKSLQRALSTVCTQLSEEQSLKCQTIVQLFTPYIRQLELGSDKNFCKQLAICQTPAIDLQPAKPIVLDDSDESSLVKDSKATPKCTICQYAISYLDAALKNNKSEQAVEAALAKVCTILPEKQRSECNQLIKTYGDVIAELIAQSADPNTICQYLGVCQESIDIIEQNSYTCTICQYVISRMKLFFGLSQNENEILESLKGSCDLFSVDSLKKQCQNFVDQYEAHFAPIISNEIEPKIACQGIDICRDHHHEESTTTTTAEPVTKHGKCIFGMSYWCASRENAQLCNAVQLCELHVWSKKKKIIIT